LTLVDILSAGIALPAIAAQAIFASEVLIGIARSSTGGIVVTKGHATIIIPAHNEAPGIGAMLQRLHAVIPTGTKILVVADNCTDNTAAIAHDAGATVVERQDQVRRGKGYALDFGRLQLQGDACSTVIVLDADCVPEPGSVAALIHAVESQGVPAQSINLLTSGLGRGPMVEISSFAFMIKNLVRQRGLVRTGGPALLTGTGMAFPRQLFDTIPLATSNIVEDLGLTVRLSLDGVKPVLVPAARVWSAPASEKDTLIQRERWEHGFLATAARFGLPTIASGLTRGRWGAVRLGLHLLVPPLVLLFALTGAVLAVLATLVAFGGSTMFMALLAAVTIVSLLLLLLAWAREGRAFLSAGSIMRIPLYMLWKIPLYLKLIRGRQTEWIRTERDQKP
jgi:cellulose synthase/poly-beta-1,6-N-acetylglucosamine synthase-like glycosyltransferase